MTQLDPLPLRPYLIGLTCPRILSSSDNRWNHAEIVNNDSRVSRPRDRSRETLGIRD